MFLTKEKLDQIGERLEHAPQKSLKRLAQETGMSRSSARNATNYGRCQFVWWQMGVAVSQS